MVTVDKFKCGLQLEITHEISAVGARCMQISESLLVCVEEKLPAVF